ncbi:MAG: hypothetical protein AAF726_01385 [Planctomycetota bacterium]
MSHASLASIVSLALVTLSPATSELQRGQKAEHRFDKTLLNGLGVTSLDDLRGKPILVAYWGHATWADDWVDDAVVWQKQFGDDLAVIMADVTAPDLDTIEAVALQKKWHGSRLMWTKEYVAYAGHEGVPQFSLLDADGRLLFDGTAGTTGMNFTGRELQDLEDAIAEQVRLRREGPDGTPPAVGGTYRCYAKGEIARAFADARALVGGEGSFEARADASAAAVALAEFERRVGRSLSRVEALLDAGRMVEAEAELAPLEGELDGEAELRTRYEALVERHASDASAEEREAAEALAKIKAKIDRKGLKKASVRALESFAKKHAGTQSAARAERWASLAD